jgi:hypothetical protein
LFRALFKEMWWGGTHSDTHQHRNSRSVDFGKYAGKHAAHRKILVMAALPVSSTTFHEPSLEVSRLATSPDHETNTFKSELPASLIDIDRNHL